MSLKKIKDSEIERSLICGRMNLCCATFGVPVTLKQQLHVKQKCCTKVLATVNDNRKMILLQRMENFPKTFFEKWAWPHINHIAVFKYALL